MSNDETAPMFAMDCDECGFIYDESEHLGAADAIVAGAAAIAHHLRGLADADARRRPTELIWSPLEYACHVRDVLLVQRERVLLARRSPTSPRPEPMGRDERVEHDGYNGQNPDAVARQLVDASTMLANVLERLDDDGWSRTVVYNYPKRSERTLQWVAIHTVHEVRHHLGDLTRDLAAPEG